MARIDLIVDRSEDLTPEQLDVFDLVAASRGKMIRPFEVLIHIPGMARPLSELGAAIRFGGALRDRDRELVIMATAAIHGCAFEWKSHEPIALAAGVRREVLDRLETGQGDLSEHESLVVGFVDELCDTGSLSDATYQLVVESFGEAGVVELATVVGYYTLLAFVMGAVDAC